MFSGCRCSICWDEAVSNNKTSTKEDKELDQIRTILTTSTWLSVKEHRTQFTMVYRIVVFYLINERR
jgi:hypothetical protein